MPRARAKRQALSPIGARWRCPEPRQCSTWGLRAWITSCRSSWSTAPRPRARPPSLRRARRQTSASLPQLSPLFAVCHPPRVWNRRRCSLWATWWRCIRRWRGSVRPPESTCLARRELEAALLNEQPADCVSILGALWLTDRLSEAPLRDPGQVEQARLILRSSVAQNRDDGVPRTHLLRERHRRGHIDSRRASEQQAFLAQQPINEVHGFRILHPQPTLTPVPLPLPPH